MTRSRLRHILAAPFVLAVLAPATGLPGPPKPCCDIIRVDSSKGIVWLRNPANGLLAQFNPGAEDIGNFKVGDRFNPDTNTLNGNRLDRKYALVEPDLDPPNASIVRARGAEVVARGKENEKVYRFYTLSFGAVLSSLKPGTEIVIDETEKWAIIRWVSRTEASVLGKKSKLKPQTYAFELD